MHFLKTYSNENVNTKTNNTDLNQKHSKLFVVHVGQGCLVLVASSLPGPAFGNHPSGRGGRTAVT